MSTEKTHRLAVLIDADNAQSAITAELLAEIAQYGRATVKRAYGDWTTTNLKGWKECLHKHAIQPIQQFSYTTGKNSTDSSLIIDAMDLLHSGNFEGYCLVSSDSDFTRLATRLKESGAIVYGFGEAKTPVSFVSACNKFVYTEILRSKPGHVELAQKGELTAPLEAVLRSAVDATSRDSGWSHLGAVGSMMSKNDPSFDPRNYGYSKLSDLVRAQPYLEVRDTPSDMSGGVVYVRVKH